MAKSYNELRKKMSPERREKNKLRTQMLLEEMAINELRKARELTQQDVANKLQVNQAAVSKLERQSDMYISTLRRVLGAMGCKLRIVAHFPDRDIVINQFEDIAEKVNSETAKQTNQ